jgi:hypothetical protein
MLFSAIVVRAALPWTGHAFIMKNSDAARSGKLIGNCENIFVVTLVLLDAFTALALVFAAKSLVRKDQVPDAEYFLGGTLVNATWSLLIALLARWLVQNAIV